MERKLAIIMAYEAQKQARMAYMSAKNIDYYLKELFSEANSFDFNKDIEDKDQFWLNIQSFLICSANVSKLLWGEYGKSHERKEVRALLQTGDKSELRSRRLRNHFEHYDQRLIDWNKESKTKSIAQNIIAPEGTLDDVMDKKDMMRYYDPSTGIVTFRGETFKLGPVSKEIKRIMSIKLPFY
jgi:hypothetical protein